MLTRSLLFIIALFSFCTLRAQGFKMQYSNSFADCFGALEVLDFDNLSNITFPGNYGNTDDLFSIDPDFHEVNSVWLRLEPNMKGRFEFEIFTENNVDFSICFSKRKIICFVNN